MRQDHEVFRVHPRLRAGAPPCDLDVVCRTAIGSLRAAGLPLVVEHERAGEPAGEWDPVRLAEAVSCLLEVAAARSTGGAPLRLRWRGDGDEVAIRVEAPGGRGPLRMDFDWGEAREDGPKAALARRIALAHGGMLARFRTSRATTYVMVLPRLPGAGGSQGAA
jgi:hypothetical protein